MRKDRGEKSGGERGVYGLIGATGRNSRQRGPVADRAGYTEDPDETSAGRRPDAAPVLRMERGFPAKSAWAEGLQRNRYLLGRSADGGLESHRCAGGCVGSPETRRKSRRADPPPGSKGARFAAIRPVGLISPDAPLTGAIGQDLAHREDVADCVLFRQEILKNLDWSPTRHPAGSAAHVGNSAEFHPRSRNSSKYPLTWGGDWWGFVRHEDVAECVGYRQEIPKNPGGSTTSWPAGSTAKARGASRPRQVG